MERLEQHSPSLHTCAGIGGVKIGDGTAPSNWPAYAKHGEGIICNFNHCGHTGSLGSPAQMSCGGKNCSCSCCRLLAGGVEHGCTYGARTASTDFPIKEAARAVHKSAEPGKYPFPATACDANVDQAFGAQLLVSENWNDVTCKLCLRQKTNPKSNIQTKVFGTYHVLAKRCPTDIVVSVHSLQTQQPVALMVLKDGQWKIVHDIEPLSPQILHRIQEWVKSITNTPKTASTITARTKLGDLPIHWEEMYTPDTAYFKAMYEDVVGPGSYYRFEGTDANSGDDYFAVIGPAKMHEPEAKFFAGTRKLPSDFSAGGKYFPEIKEAIEYAQETWGLPIPTNTNTSYDSVDLRGISPKMDKWRDVHSKEEILAHFTLPLTDKNEKEEATEASMKPKFIRTAQFPYYKMIKEAMPKGITFANKGKYYFFDVEHPEADPRWQEVKAHVPAAEAALTAARKLQQEKRSEIAERYGEDLAELYDMQLGDLHKFYLAVQKGVYEGVPDFKAISIGPYLDEYFIGGIHKFDAFTKNLKVLSSNEMVHYLEKAIENYKAEFGVNLKISDFAIPDVVNGYVAGFEWELKPPAKQKVVNEMATKAGIPLDGEEVKNLSNKCDEKGRDYLVTRAGYNRDQVMQMKSEKLRSELEKLYDQYAKSKEEGTAFQYGNEPPPRHFKALFKFEGSQLYFGGIKAEPAFTVTTPPGNGTEITVEDRQSMVKGTITLKPGMVARFRAQRPGGKQFAWSQHRYVIKEVVYNQNPSVKQISVTLQSPYNEKFVPQGMILDKNTFDLEHNIDWNKPASELMKEPYIQQMFGIEPGTVNPKRLAQVKKQIEHIQKADQVQNYGCDSMQQAIDRYLNGRTSGGNYVGPIPTEEDVAKLKIAKNYTMSDLEEWRKFYIYKQWKNGEKPDLLPTDPKNLQELEADPGVQKLLALESTKGSDGKAITPSQPTDDFELTEAPAEETSTPSVPSQSALPPGGQELGKATKIPSKPTVEPAAAPAPSPASPIISDEARRKLQDLQKRKKQKGTPGVFASVQETMRNLVKLAELFDNEGKVSEAKEIHRILRKYNENAIQADTDELGFDIQEK